MLIKEADLESTDGYVLKIAIYLIVHLLVPIRVCFQGFTFPRMDRDNSKSMGLGTLLHVTKREPKA